MITISLPLLKKARLNSALLGITFSLQTAAMFVSQNYFLAALGALAAFVTISDTVQLHECIKEINAQIETQKGEKNG
jgi:hypothetical protein